MHHWLNSVNLPPIQKVYLPECRESGLQILMLREDLNHCLIQGNKLRKLKYNIIHTLESGHKTVVSFGGIYSNHIHALSVAAKEAGLEAVGVIRGTPAPSYTMKFAESNGMKLHFVSRADYRQKQDIDWCERLKLNPDTTGFIPEGGTNHFAAKGYEEVMKKIESSYSYIVVPCGTGGTLAGVISGMKNDATGIGISMLKGSDTLSDKVSELLKGSKKEWKVISGYHQGGYAKMNSNAANFIRSFHKLNGIWLDPVYNAKTVMAVVDLASKGMFANGSTVLLINTGGIQGFSGYQNFFPEWETIVQSILRGNASKDCSAL